MELMDIPECFRNTRQFKVARGRACRKVWHYAENIFHLVCIRQHSSCCVLIYFELCPSGLL